MSTGSVRTVMVLLMVVCCGCGLKVDRYNCTIPISGLNDPACTEVGGVFVCTTNGTVKPWLSDDDEGTQYIWRGTAELDLYIPNSVCVEAIVMTFNKPTGQDLPELTIEPNVTVSISSPPTPDGPVNTTVTFTQPYCRQTVRINMTLQSTADFIVLRAVTLIESITPETVAPSVPATASTGLVTTTVLVPTILAPPVQDPPIALGATLAAAGGFLILVAVVVAGSIVVCYLLRKIRTPSQHNEENDYDYVGDCLEHVKMEENPAYQRTDGDVKMEENPAYQRKDGDVRMEENPAYQRTSGDVKMEENPAYQRTDGDVRMEVNPAHATAQARIEDAWKIY